MIKYFFILVSGCVFCSCSSLINREPATSVLEKPIQRKYIEGETLKYRILMSHVYDGKETSTYDSIATGIVRKDQQGSFFEEFQWTSILDEGVAVKFTKADKEFRQILSLSPPFKLAIPKELTNLSPFMMGPITDFLTFYVDQSLIIRESSALQKAGDHIYLNTAIASSWGKGQDCLDFDVSLASVDQNKKIAEIIVSHLPPSKICITPAAPWMYEQTTESPNNWYNVEKEANNWLASALIIF